MYLQGFQDDLGHMIGFRRRFTQIETIFMTI